MAHLGAKDFDTLKFRENHSRLPEAFKEDDLLSALERVNDLFDEYLQSHLKMTRDSNAKSSDFRRMFLSRFNADKEF